MTTINEEALPSPLDPVYLAAFCERYRIVELALVGSAARGELGPTSDYDFLVSFAQDSELSFMDFVSAKLELEDRLKRDVDLIDRSMLRNPYRKRMILRDLVPLYAA